MAAIQSTVYHCGHPTGARHSAGASAADTAAIAGAIHGEMPRRVPNAVRPAELPMSSTAAPARKSAVSHASHSAVPSPTAGAVMPFDRRRSKYGEMAATSAVTTAATQRRPHAEACPQQRKQHEQHQGARNGQRAHAGRKWTALGDEEVRRIKDPRTIGQRVERENSDHTQGETDRYEASR